MLSPVILAQVLLNGLSLSAVYILIALGFTLLFGIMRVVNFAHGSFAMLGGYALYYVYGKYHVPYAVAVPLAAAMVDRLAGAGTVRLPLLLPAHVPKHDRPDWT